MPDYILEAICYILISEGKFDAQQIQRFCKLWIFREDEDE